MGRSKKEQSCKILDYLLRLGFQVMPVIEYILELEDCIKQLEEYKRYHEYVLLDDGK